MRHRHPLAFISLLALAGCSGSAAPDPALSSTAQRDDKVSSTVPAGTCTDGVVGDGTCTPYGDFKTAVTMACAAQGGALTAFDVDPQGCPDGTVPSAAYTCCLPPPPDPTAPTCTGGAVGDGETCVDEATLHDEASALCDEAGLAFTDFYPNPCADGGVNIAKYVCCSQ